YLVATQAHPELRSRPTRPHPLFAGLVKAAVTRNEATRRAAETAARPGPAEVFSAETSAGAAGAVQGEDQGTPGTARGCAQAPGTVGCT
ncbi:CTP synthase, partial [Streptomyces cyaneofuscatus]